MHSTRQRLKFYKLHIADSAIKYSDFPAKTINILNFLA